MSMRSKLLAVGISVAVVGEQRIKVVRSVPLNKHRLRMISGDTVFAL